MGCLETIEEYILDKTTYRKEKPMLLWKPAKKKKTAHAKKEPPKPYTPPDIPKFVQQSEKTKAKEEKRVPPEKAFPPIPYAL